MSSGSNSEMDECIEMGIMSGFVEKYYGVAETKVNALNQRGDSV